MAKPIDNPVAARTMLRLRPDLRWVASPGPLGDRWRVKDPVTLEYHEFGGDERFLLQQFDGRRTLDEIGRRYDQRFRPQTIRPERLQQFAAEAHARGLLLAEGRRQAAELADRGRRARRRARLATLFSALFLRLPGFDPNRLLDLFEPFTRWFWRPAAIVAVLAAALLAAALLVGRAGDVAARLPSSGEYLQAGNLALLLAAFVAMKAVHELAHGLACRYAGARCHEMGVMLIALVPCPYCDVTDLWMVTDRWKRVLVSAAGMYAELAIAVVCSFLWMATTDGVVAAILLNLMIAGAVSTLIFNANPLLKLDGYYVLSDLIDVANLHERSRRALFGGVSNWFRRLPTRALLNAFDWRLASFAAASLAYRVVVVVALAYAAYSVLASHSLRPVGDALIGLTAVGMAAGPVSRGATIVRSPLLRRTYRWGRIAAVSAGLALLTAAILTAPWPRTITAPAVFEMQDARPVAAASAGRLLTIANEGESIEAGQVIATLENRSLDRRRVRLRGDVRRLETELESLRRRATARPALLSAVPTAEASLDRARADLAQLDEEIRRLRIVAPCAGVIVGATRPAPPGPDGSLPTWRGRLVDPENTGCWVEQGDVLCLVAPDPSAIRATIMIDQADTLGVRTGLPARVLAYQSAGPALRRRVSEVARAEFQQLPAALRRHPDLLTPRGPGPADAGPALRPVLLARVDFEPAALVVGHASHGRCKIETESEPVGVVIWRWLAQAFPLLF